MMFKILLIACLIANVKLQSCHQNIKITIPDPKFTFKGQEKEANCIEICDSNLPTFESCQYSTFLKNDTIGYCFLYESLTRYQKCETCKTNEKVCEPVKCQENQFWLE